MPVYNNIDVAVESDPARIRDALVRQLYRPVRWTESVQALAGQGVTRLIECGSGAVLAGLAALVPVRRAMRVDPIHALRAD